MVGLYPKVQWLKESRNTTYWAELVSAGINLGTTALLTKATLEQLRQRLAQQNGEDKYPDLYEVVSHRINSREALQTNRNPNMQYVEVGNEHEYPIQRAFCSNQIKPLRLSVLMIES